MAASPLTDKLYCAPGNAGIAQKLKGGGDTRLGNSESFPECDGRGMMA